MADPPNCGERHTNAGRSRCWDDGESALAGRAWTVEGSAHRFGNDRNVSAAGSGLQPEGKSLRAGRLGTRWHATSFSLRSCLRRSAPRGAPLRAPQITHGRVAELV